MCDTQALTWQPVAVVALMKLHVHWSLAQIRQLVPNGDGKYPSVGDITPVGKALTHPLILRLYCCCSLSSFVTLQSNSSAASSKYLSLQEIQLKSFFW